MLIPAVGAGSVVTWAGNALFQWMKFRGERNRSHIEVEANLEKHRDRLTFDLLDAARAEALALRSEVAIARSEAADLRPLQIRLAHFEEALDHITAMLNAEGEEEKKAAARRARAFLNRMRRLAEANGTLINELQREMSAASLPNDQKNIPADQAALLRRIHYEDEEPEA